MSNIDRTTQKKRVLKWIVLSLFMLMVFTLQTTPSFLEFFGVKPILLLPLAVSIAMFEGEFAGGFAAMACGLLWDSAGESAFGSYGFLCLVVGVATGLLLRFLLRNEWFNCLALVFISSIIIVSIQFLFTYAIQGYEEFGQVFLQKHLPMIAYTTIVSPFIYFAVRLIEKIKPEEI